jgi:hypothetical protein
VVNGAAMYCRPLNLVNRRVMRFAGLSTTFWRCAASAHKSW